MIQEEKDDREVPDSNSVQTAVVSEFVVDESGDDSTAAEASPVVDRDMSTVLGVAVGTIMLLTIGAGTYT